MIFHGVSGLYHGEWIRARFLSPSRGILFAYVPGWPSSQTNILLITRDAVGTIRGNYPVIHEWLKNLYWNVAGFKETTDFTHIKENVRFCHGLACERAKAYIEQYTKSHDKINPLAITPMGPYPDVEEGVDLNYQKLTPGIIIHPAVLERQKELYGK